MSLTDPKPANFQMGIFRLAPFFQIRILQNNPSIVSQKNHLIKTTELKFSSVNNFHLGKIIILLMYMH